MMVLRRAISRQTDRYFPPDVAAPPRRPLSLYDLVGYRWHWRLRSLAAPGYVSRSAPIIVGGCGRSGTTLLQAILGNHPAISSGPESTVFLKRVTAPDDLDRRFRLPPGRVEALQRQGRSHAEFAEFFQAECLRRDGKLVWAEKTPENVGRLSFIFRHFPKARFVHVVRDGRDVACSLRRQRWMKIRRGERSSPEAFGECADYWAHRVRRGLRHRGDPRYVEIRYADLVFETEKTLRRLIAFLGLEWSDDIMRPALLEAALGEFNCLAEGRHGLIYASAVARWRSELTQEEAAIFKRRAGTLLIELGFEKDDAWSLTRPDRSPSSPGRSTPNA